MFEHINWKPDETEIRKFSLIMLTGFFIIGLILLVIDKPDFYQLLWTGTIKQKIALWLIMTGIIIFLSGFTIPAVVKLFYFVWMGLGGVLSYIINFIILAFIFYIIFCPIAIIFKLIKRDALNRFKKSGQVDTYWVDMPKITSKDYYKHQF